MNSVIHPDSSHNVSVFFKNRVILNNHFTDRKLKTEGCLLTCQRPPAKLKTQLPWKPKFSSSFCAVSTLRPSCPLREEILNSCAKLPGKLNMFEMLLGMNRHPRLLYVNCNSGRTGMKEPKNWFPSQLLDAYGVLVIHNLTSDLI